MLLALLELLFLKERLSSRHSSRDPKVGLGLAVVGKCISWRGTKALSVEPVAARLGC